MNFIRKPMPVNNGIITAPVSIEDVATCLGVGSYDLGTLCTSGKINKWAKYKPIIYNKIGELVDTERYLTNYGLDISNTYSIDISELASKAESNTTWNYLQPKSGTNWLRLTDFIKYNHQAEPIINYNYLPTELSTQSDSASVDIRIIYNNKSEFKLSDFVFFEDNGGLGNYHFAIAYYQDKNDIKFNHGPALTTTGDILIPITLPVGTWKCMLLATMETEEYTTAQPSVLLPNGFFSITVKRLIVMGIVTITNDYSNLYLDDTGIYGLYFPELSITAYNGSMSLSTGRFYVEVRCYDSNNNNISTFDVIDESNADFTYQGADTQTYSLDFLAGTPIYFNNWDANLDGTQVSWVEVDAAVTKISGYGAFGLKQRYLWTIRK